MVSHTYMYLGGIGNVSKCPISSQIPLSMGSNGQLVKHPMQYIYLSIPSHGGYIYTLSGQYGTPIGCLHAVMLDK